MGDLSYKQTVEELPADVVFVDEATAATMLGTKTSRVKQMLADNTLIGLWHKGGWWIPQVAMIEVGSDFADQTWGARELRRLEETEEDPDEFEDPTHAPLRALRGTVTLLEDGGFTMLDTYQWLFTENDAFGETPIEAIRKGHYHRVNQLAATLGW